MSESRPSIPFLAAVHTACLMLSDIPGVAGRQVHSAAKQTGTKGTKGAAETAPGPGPVDRPVDAELMGLKQVSHHSLQRHAQKAQKRVSSPVARSCYGAKQDVPVGVALIGPPRWYGILSQQRQRTLFPVSAFYVNLRTPL